MESNRACLRSGRASSPLALACWVIAAATVIVGTAGASEQVENESAPQTATVSIDAHGDVGDSGALIANQLAALMAAMRADDVHEVNRLLSTDANLPTAAVKRHGAQLLLWAVAVRPPTAAKSKSSENHAAAAATDKAVDGVVQQLLAAGAAADVRSPRPNNDTPLHLAAQLGRASVVELLLAHGAEIEAKDAMNKTPLLTAAAAGADKAVERLLQHGASIKPRSRRGEAAIHLAADAGVTESVRLLLQAGASVDAKVKESEQTPLHRVIRRNPVSKGAPLARLLIEAGAPLDEVDAKGKTPLYYAASQRLVKYVSLLAEAGADPTIGPTGDPSPVHKAAAQNDFDILHALLKSGAAADAGSDGVGTPLLVAVDATPPKTESVEVLLHFGASPDAATADGHSALHRAVLSRTDKVLDLLIAAGADVNASTQEAGMTALHVAAQTDNAAAAKALIAAGADVGARVEMSGETPLHTASARGAVAVARALLDAGAAVDEESNQGETPLQYAVSSRKRSMVEFLTSRGADPQRESGHDEL